MNRRLFSLTILCCCIVLGLTRSVYAYTSPLAVSGAELLVAENDAEDGEKKTIVMDFRPVEKEMSRDYSGTFLDGVTFGPIDLSDLTYDEARRSITLYMTSLQKKKISLTTPDGMIFTCNAEQLGLSWNRDDTLYEALMLGQCGNVISRYKAMKDLERENKTFDIDWRFDETKVRKIVEKQAEKYHIEPTETLMYLEEAEDGKKKDAKESAAQFVIEEGQTGRSISVSASTTAIMAALNDWDGEDKEIPLAVTITEPKGTKEELRKVKDVLGTFSTSFGSSNSNRTENLRNGAALINGTILYPGEEFSTYRTVAPFTEENGYFLAGSYLNGTVVETLGGGICQVSTTLYNAVLLAELEVTERFNHSMVVKYVKLSGDAAISGTEKDFKFRNNLQNPIYIEGKVKKDKKLVFTIYGVESRPENRTVELESIETYKADQGPDVIQSDPSKPVGYIKATAGHTGYSGEYWRIIQVDGVETEREKVNTSHYPAIAGTVVVGTGSADPAISASIQAAAESGNVGSVYGAIAQTAAPIAEATTEITAED